MTISKLSTSSSVHLLVTTTLRGQRGENKLWRRLCFLPNFDYLKKSRWGSSVASFKNPANRDSEKKYIKKVVCIANKTGLFFVLELNFQFKYAIYTAFNTKLLITDCYSSTNSDSIIKKRQQKIEKDNEHKDLEKIPIKF